MKIKILSREQTCSDLQGTNKGYENYAGAARGSGYYVMKTLLVLLIVMAIDVWTTYEKIWFGE